MKDTNTRFGNANWRAALLALFAFIFTGATGYASDYYLEGQHRGDTNTWSAVNLQNWRELDYIPCRVRITSGPVNNQTVTITFPHLTGTTPGFQNLYAFTNSPNVVFVSPPALSAPQSGDWSYTFTINITDGNPAAVGCLARLAAGAHLNTGSSLKIGGTPSSMGELQIHKPQPGPGQPNLAILKTGPATAAQGDIITYTLSYTNQAKTNTAVGVQISDILPSGITVLSNSLAGNASLIGHTIFWDLPDLSGRDSGQVTFQAQINNTTPVGRVITNYCQILSSEDDANYGDNSSKWLTTVTSGCSMPPLVCPSNKVVECGTDWAFDNPTASDNYASNSLIIVGTVTNALCGQTFSATRTWQATDICGNVAQCGQTVTVVDTTPPIINCPANKTVEIGTPWTFGNPQGGDSCGTNTLTIVCTVTNAGCGNTFTATRTWRKTDACGNTAQCSQTVTVLDTTAPSLTCSPNKTVEVGNPWSFDPPVASDGCGTNSVSIVNTVTNTLCGNTYSAKRTWRATDACGNTAECSQTVTLIDSTSPTVSIVSPTNGTVYVAPANITVQANAFDVGGMITKVEFFESTNKFSEITNGTPYVAGTNGVPAGNYTFVARATDACGNMSTSAPVSVVVLDRPPLTIVSAMAFNPQTGLLEQKVRVFNPTLSEYKAVRVYAENLTNGVTLWNKSGVTNNIPYVQSNDRILPGTYVDMILEYYVPTPTAPQPQLRAELVEPVEGGGAVAVGTGQTIVRAVMLSNGTFLLEFNSVSNRIYYVQYCNDMRTWKTAQPAITGTGTRIQWVDNGQPKTESAPSSEPMRFYRIIAVP